jgi:uncharacterized protein (TIGR03067 family)
VRRYFLLLCVLAFAIVAVGAERTDNLGAGAKTAPDLDLNGVWRGFVVKGKGEQPDRGSVHLELTIKGDRISAKRLDGEGGSLGNGTYTITVGRFYMIDATEARSRGKGRTYQGICKFGPDLMKWCTATPGNPRPTNFETKGQQFLLVLKRQR